MQRLFAGGFLPDPSSVPPVILALAAVNVAVFAMWKTLPTHLMMRHFTVSVSGLVKHKRLHTMLTSVFSHEGGWHLLFNTLIMVNLGTTLVQIMDEKTFLALYLGAGLFSGACGLAWHMAIAKRWGPSSMHTAMLGGSGAVFAMFAITAALFPTQQFYIIFLPFWPIEAQDMIKFAVAFDVLGLGVSLYRGSPLGHAAHLGGVLCGTMFLKLYLEDNNRKAKYLMNRNRYIEQRKGR
jgi:membrane associated rhomboid family serine protease